MEPINNISVDKMSGMFMGAFLGDALGAPHEFRCNSHIIYTGKLEHQAFYISQFQGRRELAVGQVTDDSEMSLTLLRSIIENKGYDRDKVIKGYMNWCNSGGWMIGKNTRAILKGVTTLRGYQNRIKKILLLPEEERSQSNGGLMRCTHLAL